MNFKSVLFKSYLSVHIRFIWRNEINLYSFNRFEKWNHSNQPVIEKYMNDMYVWMSINNVKEKQSC